MVPSTRCVETVTLKPSRPLEKQSGCVWANACYAREVHSVFSMVAMQDCHPSEDADEPVLMRLC